MCSASAHYIAAFVVSLLVASSVSHVYWTLKRHYTPKSMLDVVFVHLPFSLWHAYSLIAILLSASAAFEPHSPPAHPDLVEKLLVLGAEWFLTMTAMGYAFESQRGDSAGATVIAIFLLGVFTRKVS